MKQIIKCILLVILFSLLNMTIQAQSNKTIDSLKTLINIEKDGLKRIILINRLSKAFFYNNLDSAYKQASKAAYLITKDSRFNSNSSDTITRELKKQYANSLYIMGNYYLKKDDYTKSLQKLNQALTIQEKINDSLGISYTYNSKGLNYESKSDYDSALIMYEKSLHLKKLINDKKGVATTYGNIGVIYINKGNYNNAMKFLYEGLKIHELLNYTQGMAVCYSNITRVNILKKDYVNALKTNDISISLYTKINNQVALINMNNDRGIIYKNLEKYNDAISCYRKAMDLSIKLNKPHFSLYANIGNLYRIIKDYPNAEKYLLIALKKANEIKNYNDISNSYINLGVLYSDKKQFNLSISHLLYASKICDSLKLIDDMKSCYESLSITYLKTNNYKEALNYYKRYTQLKDSSLNQESLKQINELSAKYESEKKDKEISLLNKEKALQESELKQQTTLRNFLIGLSLLIILSTIITVLYFRQKIKTTAIILSKTEEVNKQNAYIAGQEDERRRIAKDIHDGVGGTLAAIKLNLERIKNTELDIIINNVSNACKEVRAISHNLASPVFYDTNFIDVLKELSNSFSIPEKREIHFNYFPEEELNTLAITIREAIYRTLQELLTNINKHANATKVEIGLSKEDPNLFLFIEDNGVGFDANSAKLGLGLKNIESRIIFLNGKLELDSKVGRGTAITINIPLA